MKKVASLITIGLVAASVSYADYVQTNIGAVGLGGLNLQYQVNMGDRFSLGPTYTALAHDKNGLNSAAFAGLRAEYQYLQLGGVGLWAGVVGGVSSVRTQGVSKLDSSACQEGMFGAYNSLLLGSKIAIEEKLELGMALGASVYYPVVETSSCSGVLKGSRVYDFIEMAPVLEVNVGYRF